MKKSLILILIIVSASISPMTLGQTQPTSDSSEPETEDSISLSIVQAIDRGLNYLVKTQSRSGCWSQPEYTVAISSLAGLALCGEGGVYQGPRSKAIKLLTDYLLSVSNRRGLIAVSTEQRHAWGNAFAHLFLTQVYGMLGAERDRKIRSQFKKGADFIISQQQPNGSWGHDYAGTHAELCTMAHIQTLRELNRVGIEVPKQVVERAVKYVRNLAFHQRNTSPGYRVAALASLLAAGVYHEAKLPAAIDEFKAAISYDFKTASFPIYFHLYASQIMYFSGEDNWDQYYQKMVAFSLKQQVIEKDGSGYWPAYPNVHALTPTPVYSTAVITLILQMPNRYLPFYEQVRQEIKKKKESGK